MKLLNLLLVKEPILITFQKQLLYDLFMHITTRPAKMIIRYVEPLINLFVNVVIV